MWEYTAKVKDPSMNPRNVGAVINLYGEELVGEAV